MLEKGITAAALGAAGDLLRTDQHVAAVTSLETEERLAGALHCGLRIADCGLRIAVCGLRIADCGLRIANDCPTAKLRLTVPPPSGRR